MHRLSLLDGSARCASDVFIGGGDVGGASGGNGAEFGTLQHEPCTSRGGRPPTSCALTPSYRTTWIPDRGREGGRFCPDCANRVQHQQLLTQRHSDEADGRCCCCACCLLWSATVLWLPRKVTMPHQKGLSGINICLCCSFLALWLTIQQGRWC